MSKEWFIEKDAMDAEAVGSCQLTPAHTQHQGTANLIHIKHGHRMRKLLQ
jgi:hypothetical protein